ESAVGPRFLGAAPHAMRVVMLSDMESRVCPRTVPVIALASLLLAGVGPAQGADALTWHPGRVLDADGRPVVGAEVTFVSTLAHALDEWDDHVARATSDARGRFRVALRPVRSYRAWAVQRGPDGVLVGNVVPMQPASTELSLAAASAAATQWSILGTGPWRECGPLRLQLVVEGSALVVGELVVGDEGLVEVPPLPPAVGVLFFVRDRLVWSTAATLTEPLRLPPPWHVAMRVQDAAGRPVSDAMIYRLEPFQALPEPFVQSAASGRRWPVGASDRDGRADVLVATASDPFAGVDSPLCFIACKPGHSESVAGFHRQPFADTGELPPDSSHGPLQFQLACVPQPQGRVRAAGDRLPAHLQVVQSLVVQQSRGTAVLVDRQRIEVAPDGAFELRQSRARTQPLAVVVAQQMPPLARDDPFVRAAAPTDLVLPPFSASSDEGLDLRSLQALRLLVVDDSGGPAGACTVVCTPLGARRYLPAALAMRSRTDQGGRVVLPVLPGTWLVFVAQDGGFAHREIEVREPGRVQTLRLEPWLVMAMRVHKADGRLVQGAHVSSDLRDAGRPAVETPAQQWLRECLGLMFGDEVRSLRSDAAGRLVLRFAREQGLRGTFRVVDRSWPSDPLELQAGDAVVDVVVR
ncbi:MAG TPA: carboxypeptidase-like regulatory domain-containing protein, partial [Planctomycetota bacterium]|nr:carboxypeptidase-like regulatory domain-containing protein [Planctomycetota bacterium]